MSIDSALRYFSGSRQTPFKRASIDIIGLLTRLAGQTILKKFFVNDKKGSLLGIEFFVWCAILIVEEERSFPPMR